MRIAGFRFQRPCVFLERRSVRGPGIRGPDRAGIAALEEAAGSLLTTPDDDPPTITAPVLRERRLDLVRRIDPVNDGRMPQLLEIVRTLRRAAGPDVPLFALVSAPFRSACMLRGLANLFTDMYDDPGFVTALVDFCVEPCVAFGRALAEAGADVVEIGNASSSSNMISREAYARFVHPSNRALIAALKATGITTACTGWLRQWSRSPSVPWPPWLTMWSSLPIAIARLAHRDPSFGAR